MKRTITIIIICLLLAAGVSCLFYFTAGGGLDEWLDEIIGPEKTTVVKEEPQKPKEEAPEPAPTEQPKPEPPKETPKPQPLPQLTERPHSAEHAVVLHVTQAAKPEAAEGTLDQLAERVGLSKENAETLREWVKEHPDFKVEEIGLAETNRQSGEKETRYRLVSDKGDEDIIISVTTPKKGTPTISHIEKVAADRTQVTPQSDALTVVEGFVEALKQGDMSAARRLTSGEEISDATLAGLCIMFEDGDFSMRKKLPIRNMFKNEEAAGYIIYMAPHDESGQAGNVGIEMGFDAARGWTVKAVAMDNLLDRYEASGAAEGGVYFPIVKNPQGGDSLVLYFGFNDATPSPRSLRQLKIVANLLKGSQGTLNISGHTDDIGTVEYNQQLSERRAAAVKDTLIANGVRESQITTQGLGKSQPRRTYHVGDTRETIRTIRSGNRRAEIYLDF